jgi:hypothetical protein
MYHRLHANAICTIVKLIALVRGHPRSNIIGDFDPTRPIFCSCSIVTMRLFIAVYRPVAIFTMLTSISPLRAIRGQTNFDAFCARLAP